MENLIGFFSYQNPKLQTKKTLLLYLLLAASPLASRGFSPRGLINLFLRILDLKEKHFFLVGIFFTPQENSYKPSRDL